MIVRTRVYESDALTMRAYAGLRRRLDRDTRTWSVLRGQVDRLPCLIVMAEDEALMAEVEWGGGVEIPTPQDFADKVIARHRLRTAGAPVGKTHGQRGVVASHHETPIRVQEDGSAIPYVGEHDSA